MLNNRPRKPWWTTSKINRSADAAPRCCPSGWHFRPLVHRCFLSPNSPRKIMLPPLNSHTSATKRKVQDEVDCPKITGSHGGLFAVRHGGRKRCTAASGVG